MSLLNRFTSVITSLNFCDMLHDTGVSRQFIVKGVDNHSYLLDMVKVDDNEVLLAFTNTLDGESYKYKVDVNEFHVSIINRDAPGLTNFIVLLLTYYEYRFDFDDGKRALVLQSFIEEQLEGYEAKYAKLIIDESGIIKVEIQFPYITRGLEIPYMLNGVINVIGIDHMLQSLLTIEDSINHKITDEENEENERLANTVLDIGTYYEVIALLKDDNNFINAEMASKYVVSK